MAAKYGDVAEISDVTGSVKVMYVHPVDWQAEARFWDSPIGEAFIIEGSIMWQGRRIGPGEFGPILVEDPSVVWIDRGA